MMQSEFEKYGDSMRRRTADSDGGQKEKDFFRAERLKTKTEKDYLMSLAQRPVMENMEVEDTEYIVDYDMQTNAPLSGRIRNNS